MRLERVCIDDTRGDIQLTISKTEPPLDWTLIDYLYDGFWDSARYDIVEPMISAVEALNEARNHSP